MAFVWTYTDQINAVGDSIDFEVFAELKANILEAYGEAPDDSTFNGTTGRAVTIADQGGTDYLPVVVPIADPLGNLGEVHVIIDSATQFTVYNTGSFRGAFRYKVLK